MAIKQIFDVFDVVGSLKTLAVLFTYIMIFQELPVGSVGPSTNYNTCFGEYIYIYIIITFVFICDFLNVYIFSILWEKTLIWSFFISLFAGSCGGHTKR